MNVLSLFDGISCGQLALQRAGIPYDNYFRSEIKLTANRVVRRRFPNSIDLGCVQRLKGSDLPQIDLLLAGSPCQSFSRIGDGTGINGKSNLVTEFFRIMRETKPKYFLLENVKMKPVWQKFISLNVGVEPIRLNSKLVSAQNRDRLYWTNIPNVKAPEDKGLLFKDVLEDLPFAPLLPHFSTLWSGKPRMDRFNWVNKIKSNCLTTSVSNTAQYLLNEDKSMCRQLSPIEAERLQTIPENYTSMLKKTERYDVIGDAWTVDMIAHILSYLPKDKITEK